MKNLIPAIIQDKQTRRILMLGYMDAKALSKTRKTGLVYFWSRKRNKLWLKGEESSNKLKVKEIFFDCDKDAILIKAELIGNAVCHTGSETCFINKL